MDDVNPDEPGRGSQTNLLDRPEYWSIDADLYWNAAEIVLVRANR